MQAAEIAALLKGPWLIAESRGQSADDGPLVRFTSVAAFQDLDTPWPGIPRIETPVGLALSDRGFWVKYWRDPLLAIEYQAGRSCVFLLPLLEARPQEVRARLRAGLDELTLPADLLLESFPFEETVIAGLRMETSWWRKLALRWAAEMQLTPNLRWALEQVARKGNKRAQRLSG